jgi:hypothetical protein
MPAIVLHDEEADQEKRRGDREQQREPVAHSQTEVHERPRPREQQGGADELPDAPGRVRTPERRELCIPMIFHGDTSVSPPVTPTRWRTSA